MLPTELTPQERKLLRNEEHREAIQARVESEGKEYLASLGGDYLKKYEAIEAATKLLSENGVKADINVLMPSPQFPGKDSVWNFSTFPDFIKWENGKISKESEIENAFMLYHRVGHFINNFSINCGDDIPLLPMLGLIGRVYMDTTRWLAHDIVPESIQELMDKE